MIETIYNETNSENSKPDMNIRLPKNIKQIGQGDSKMNYQIYIEENVLFYIKQKPTSGDDIRYGVLLGEKKQGNGYTYVFINGVIEVDNIIEKTIIFSDDVWTGIYDNLKRYYRKSDIVGWFGSSETDLTKDLHSIKKIHLDHFAGNGKVYLNVIREEVDEAFFAYERNGLRKQPCYHVYFEKAPEFEDYLFGTGFVAFDEIEKKETQETGKYGIALNNMKTEKNEKFKTVKFGKTASVATILALAGIVYYMGSKGQLDSLSDKMRGMVGGIVNNEKGQDEAGNIISVNGNVQRTTEVATENASLEQQTTKQQASGEKISDEKASDDKTSSEQVSGDKISSEQTSGNIINNEVTKDKEAITENQATVSVPNENYQVYIVKAGDTLYSIALAKYGSVEKLEEIIALNKLKDEDYVMEGQKIFLP